MEIATFIEVLTIIMGGGGIGAVVTWGYLRRQEAAKTKEQEANAVTAEAEAAIRKQDYYQEIIEDMKKDREYMKEIREEQEAYIHEIKADRDRLHNERNMLRKENNELRKTVKRLEDTQREQGDKIARLGRMYKAMMPLICTNTSCKKRQADVMGLVDDESFEVEEEKEDETEDEMEDDDTIGLRREGGRKDIHKPIKEKRK